jgi:GNAT superfamily N-acetyltransferase
MQRSGTILLPPERYAGFRGVHIWYVGACSFVQTGPDHEGEVAQILASLPEGTPLSGDDLQTAWGSHAITERSIGLVYYLHPDDLAAVSVADPYEVRQLAPEDGDRLQALFDACTSEEVSEAYVSTDHDIAFGCLAGDQLAAAGSGYLRAGFMDLNVLAHPAYRGRGLGRAVVSALCRSCWERDMIPQYRCDERDAYLRGLAEGLGFRLYFRQESVWLLRSARLSASAAALSFY